MIKADTKKFNEYKRYINMDKENKLKLYKDEEGRGSANTRFADEDVWQKMYR